MSCPPKSDMEKVKAIPNTVGNMAAAAGIQSCKTSASNDSTEFSAQASLELGPSGMLGSADASLQGKSQTVTSNSVGCETVVAMAKINMDVVDKVKCTLSESNGKINNNAKAYNSVKITADDLTMDCGAGGLNINQKNKVTMNSKASISSSQMSTMVNDITKSVKDMTSVLSSSTTGFGATPQGQKTLQNITNQTNTSDYQEQVKNSILSIANAADAENELVIDGRKRYKLTGGQCNINQENIIEVISSMIITDVLNNTFAEYKKQSDEYMDNVISKSESEGQPKIEGLKSMFDSLGDARAKWLTPLIIGIVVIVVAIIIGIIVLAIKPGSNKEVANKVGGILKLYKLFTHAY